MSDGILVLSPSEVGEILTGREEEVAQVVERAYVAHNRRRSALPHSKFLRFPDDEANRIVALPAFWETALRAGMKWISSFTGNLNRGRARASAILVPNECEGGRPEIVLDGSIIRASRSSSSTSSCSRASRGPTVNLSQGERKRLALLTAYLEDRPVYLFDKWAADKDPLFKEIFNLEFLPELKRRGKGVLVISHDDHYVYVADRIVKLDCGRIEYDMPEAEICLADGDLPLKALGALS